MRIKGYATRVGIGTVATLGIVVLLTFKLGQVTLNRFQEARDEELVAAAVREWAGNEPVEIRRVDVLEEASPRTVELWLIIDVPIDFQKDIMAPRDLIPPSLQPNALKSLLREALGPDVNVQFRLQFLYAGVFNLESGKRIGVTVPIERAPEPDENGIK